MCAPLGRARAQGLRLLRSPALYVTRGNPTACSHPFSPSVCASHMAPRVCTWLTESLAGASKWGFLSTYESGAGGRG